MTCTAARRTALPDGTPVLLRPVTPADAPLFFANFPYASADDLRNRFFETIRTLPATLVARLSNPHPEQEMTLVCLPCEDTPAAKPQDAYGIARVALEPASLWRGEFALIVRGDWQRRGVGRVLTRTILADAHRRGIEEIYALVLRDNRPMLGLLARFGFVAGIDPDDPMVVRAVLRLASRPDDDVLAD
jgi:acetyltransferase